MGNCGSKQKKLNSSITSARNSRPILGTTPRELLLFQAAPASRRKNEGPKSKSHRGSGFIVTKEVGTYR